MKTILFTTLALVFFSPVLFGQEKENPPKTKPGEQITVNKEFDDQGNLIRFDSTYVFEWHGDTMMAFPNWGNFNFPPGGFPDMDGFMDGFFSDSLNHYFGNDSTFEFPFQFKEFDFPDMAGFFKNFGDLDRQGQPSFQNKQQQKEWEEILKKQQKEMEEFQKKWDSKNKNKPNADIKLQKL